MIFRLRSLLPRRGAKTTFRRRGLLSSDLTLHVGGGILCLLPICLLANPTGGSVVAGSAKITGQGTGAVLINQASNTIIINWRSFSINSGETTSFLQPGANSAALNRVLGGQTSLINGTLSANGQVYLINGNGVIVGPGGVISAGAFTASTRDLANADFLSGNLHFTGSSDAGVQNLGSITALGGNVVLIGRTVDNEGTISAPRGTAGLIAGDNVLLAQDNADGSTITVSPASMAANVGGRVGVKNGGTIAAAAAELKAANGNIYGLAVQNLGTIRATTISHQGGHIWLTSDSGTVSNSGTLDASATASGGRGGEVTLKSAGGTVSHTGRIIARGGEISGAQVQFIGTVDLTAPGETRGTLLLDPETIDIITGGGADLNGSTIDPSAIVAALNSADVTLNGTTSITVDSLLDAHANANAGNLTLDTPDLQLNAPILLNGTLSGTATMVNLSAGALVQNGIDAAAAGAIIGLTGGATYDLSAEILINKPLILEGMGATLDGQGSTRIMEIDSGAVALDNLTFEGGNGSSTLGAGSSFSGYGGGLMVYGQNTTSTVTISNCTFVGNSSSGGGAIYSVIISGGSNSITIYDSTFTGNSAVNGSALYNYGAFGGNASMMLSSDTIALNSGEEAIYNTLLSSGNASVSIGNTILAGNTGYEGELEYTNGGGGTLTDNGYNLYGQNGNAGGFAPASMATTDILLYNGIGTVLTSLGNYGGTTPTMPLVAGSPAIDAGDPSDIGTTSDQRGVPRGDPSYYTGTAADIGAFEAQFVSVQADPVSIVYGQTPTFTYTITNGPPTASASISGEPALFTGATNVGSYPTDIQIGTLQESDPLYVLNFTPGNFTITPREVVVDPDPGQSKTYGTPDPVLTYSTTAATDTSGLVNGDTLEGSPSYTGAGQFANVGTYATNLGTLSNSNYTIALSAGAPTFAITPATLDYLANPVTVPAGAEFPAFTGTVVGFVGDDTLANATSGNLIFSTPATPSAPTGYYAINGSGLTAANYVFAQAAVNSAALTIGNPPPRAPANPTSPDSAPAAQAAQPNTPVSQAAAQTSSSSNTSDANASQSGGADAQSASSAPPTEDMDVTSISPNESMDSTPGQASSSGDADAGAMAQGSSFDPNVGAPTVTVGQTVTMGGSGAGAPPPPIVQAQLAQILGAPALDTLSSALASVSTADDQGGPSSTGATTTSAPGQTSSTAGATGATGGGSSANPSGPGSTGPVTVIAPGQTISLGGGKANSGPPPASVQAAFDQGFSPESRDTLSKALGE
jgi:filamentous hemagglutinin family protein